MAENKKRIHEKEEEVAPYYESFCGNKTRKCCIANADCSREIKVLANGTIIESDLCCYY